MDILNVEANEDENLNVENTENSNVDFSEPVASPTVIKVVGCGGGGSNAVNRMVAHDISNVDFIVLNTDLQALARNNAKTKIPIGQKVTKGLGAGGKPEVGEKAAEEDKEVISKVLKGADMVFITAGMGGGTGTGSAPVVARIAKELGCLTVAVVTTPFEFEGQVRMRQAQEGLKKLHEQVDSLIVIPNEQLFKNIDKNLTVRESFKRADEILSQGVEGISNIITNPGDVNTDFADVRNAMSGQGNAIFGIGVAEGENRAVEAASKAINNPMLENSRIDGAKNLLINICSSEEITLNEVGEITKIVSSSADKDYNMFWGQVTQPELGNKISVTVIATGFEANGNNFVEKKDFVPEPVQKTVDPNVVDNDEFLSILKNTTSSTSSVSSLQTESKSTAKTNEFDFFGSSFNQKTEKNNEETIGAAFAKDDVPNLHLSQASKSIKAREGYVPQGNLNEPAIWSNPDFGRTINLFDD